MGAIRTQHLPNYTIDDYRQWEGDWQLIDGVPFAMSPSANRNHQRFARDILLMLNESLMTNNSCDCEVVYELDLFINRQTVVRPDLMVIWEHSDTEYPMKAPALIIEVISKSSEQMDRQIKREMYATFGVPNYWMADPKDRSMEYLVLNDGAYRPVERPSQISLEGCVLTLDWEKLKI